VNVYILFLWLAATPHPKAYGVYESLADCQHEVEIANAGRAPLAYCEPVKLTKAKY